MSEKKLCPFRKTGVHRPDGGEEFAPCLEGECQAWRVIVLGVHEFAKGEIEKVADDKVRITYSADETQGYCGLAGKP